MPRRSWLVWLVILFSSAEAGVLAQETGETRPDAVSLLGRPLYSPEMPAERRAQLEENLARAKADLERDPDNLDAIIWLGRRTAYLGRYREAIAIYSKGIERHPRNAKLYRHRGHRYLTVREIAKAIRDLEKASRLVAGTPDEIEPDGAPNSKNIPRSTTQTNIWYHLGLGYYLKGDFAKARRAFATCLGLAKNDDMEVATRYWLYLTLLRFGQQAEAGRVLEPIRQQMDIIENFAYHNLLLFYKGEKPLEKILESAQTDDVARATTLYGVGSWYLVNGHGEKAKSVFREAIAGKQWAAFGFLAAEAELARRSSR